MKKIQFKKAKDVQKMMKIIPYGYKEASLLVVIDGKRDPNDVDRFYTESSETAGKIFSKSSNNELLFDNKFVGNSPSFYEVIAIVHAHGIMVVEEEGVYDFEDLVNEVRNAPFSTQRYQLLTALCFASRLSDTGACSEGDVGHILG